MPASNTPKRKKIPVKKPKISLLNQQADWNFSGKVLQQQCELAWNRVTSRRPARTRHYREIEVVIVTPSVSRQWHDAHFGDPTPTDVMTFPAPPLATIMVCPEIAAKQRHLEKLTHHDEVLTYIIHGLLHLAGWDDLTDAQFSAMQKEQERILAAVTCS